MIIMDVHARDIVSRFVRDSILDAREFDWESQLRFYFDKAADAVVLRQCTGSFDYGYEYIGLRDRLVITPLTDRCYMTLTQVRGHTRTHRVLRVFALANGDSRQFMAHACTPHIRSVLTI